MSNQNRVRPGVPEGGRYTNKEHAEPTIGLGKPAPAPADPGPAGPDELRAMARSSDPDTRAAAATGLRVPDDVLEELADPSQPTEVRLAAAATGYGASADRASHDPNPLVRALSLGAGVLSPENRRRVEKDPAVRNVMSFITA